MSHLTDQQRAELRDKLLMLRQVLVQRSGSASEDKQPVSLDQPIGRLTRMDAIQQQQMALGQQRRLEQELERVNAALQQLERQQYGFCLRCQEAIPYERLQIRPIATLCYECQRELERGTNK